MSRPLRISITTGDTSGIGLEVAAKALAKIGPRANVQFLLWRSSAASAKYLKRIDGHFNRVTVKSWPEALKISPDSYKTLVDIKSNSTPADWVVESAKAGVFGHIDALATAPLSKTSIVGSGLKDLGHTAILQRISGSSNLFMTFIGKRFSVLLATGHIPLHEVSKRLRGELLESAIRASREVLPWLSKRKALLPIAVVGLNPHSGESNLIGSEESDVFSPVIEKLNGEEFTIQGPIVPDVAFQESQWNRYSIYVCPYHDQGLIPFKMIHGFSGVHITMGLPFVRTSVDHGTAKDIFGKDRADPKSMIEAIKWAINLSRQRIEMKSGRIN